MKKTAFILLLLISLHPDLYAQTYSKDALNTFAMFNKTGDIKLLEQSRKQIDESFKSAKDSASYKSNLVRAMIYSSLAAVDSNLSLNYKTDPMAEALWSLSQLNHHKVIEDSAKIIYIKNQLAVSGLFRARRALENYAYDKAIKAYELIDSLQGENAGVWHNLAVLYDKTGDKERAIEYYNRALKVRPRPEYYLTLAGLYEERRDESRFVETLRQGREDYPDNRDLINREINYYAEKEDYLKVIELLPAALELEQYNLNLNYLAGFSYQATGKFAQAEEYYEKVLNIDQNNYDGNYALGLLYLHAFLKAPGQRNLMYLSRQFLTKAHEIDPNQIKTLQALALLYKQSGDDAQLQKVNIKINQLKFN